MIYVRLAGGLGNQLYQLSAAALLHVKTGLKVALVLDSLNKYEAKREPHSLRLLGGKWIQQVLVLNRGLAAKAISRARVGRWLPWVGVTDGNYWRCMAGAGPASGVYILDGYFQHGWTQAKLSAAVAELAPVSARPSCPARPNECLIHVRGGDFLKVPTQNILTEAYYSDAVARAEEAGFKQFLVMTDDYDYAAALMAKVGLGSHQYRVLEPSADPLEDFFALSAAPARIISNSTFAWWAVAVDPDKKQTFSPSCFWLGQPRDLVLEWETVVAV